MMEERSVLDLGRRVPHFDDLSLYGCGFVDGQPGQGNDLDGCPAYQLYFVSEGRGELQADGRAVVMGRGEGFLVLPGQNLSLRADGQEPWAYFWIRFCGAKAEDCLRLAGVEKTTVFRCAGGTQLLGLIREMAALEAPGAENEFMLQGLLFRFFACLAHNLVSGAEDGKRENAYVQKAVEYIHNSYSTGITVGDVAHYVSLNRSYLSTLFQRVLEVSPQDYLAYYRMSRAKERLVQTNDTVASIASSCGYADPQVFSRAFKQQVGMTPVNYRRTERAAEPQEE